MADCAGASYSAIPCSTARHSESSAISVSSVAQILSCWIISGSTAVFSKSRHRLASPKIWRTSRISTPNLITCYVKSKVVSTPPLPIEMRCSPILEINISSSSKKTTTPINLQMTLIKFRIKSGSQCQWLTFVRGGGRQLPAVSNSRLRGWADGGAHIRQDAGRFLTRRG